MPVGTPLSKPVAPPVRPAGASKPAAPAPAQSGAGTVEAAGSGTRAYTSPSLKVPGEWVGEPMPISRPTAASTPRPEPVMPQATAAPVAPVTAAAAKAAPAENPEASPAGTAPGADSFMDFIAGAEPVKKAIPPLPLLGEVNAPAAAPAPLPEEARPRPTTAPEEPPAAAVSQPAPPVSSVSSVPPVSPVPPVAAQPGPDKTILELVERLDAAMDEARQAFEARRPFQVGTAAGRIAAESDAFGFRVLARMARCVERAAKANDIGALKDLQPELAVAVERNRSARCPRR
ncbi:MAG: hypothetical protein Q4F27_06055, partial [Desulfovibrionaceae bacterium]|nr:hypothetical protein [Desulfovibrionaceae bacterium]